MFPSVTVKDVLLECLDEAFETDTNIPIAVLPNNCSPNVGLSSNSSSDSPASFTNSLNQASKFTESINVNLVRKIKNRVSAQNWREKRKKEVQALESTNKRLCAERDALVDYVAQIEKQNQKMQSQLLEMKMLMTSFAGFNGGQSFGIVSGKEEARPSLLNSFEHSNCLGKPKVLVVGGNEKSSLPLGLLPTFLAPSHTKLTSLQSRLLLQVETIWHSLVLQTVNMISFIVWKLYWIDKAVRRVQRCFRQSLK